MNTMKRLGVSLAMLLLAACGGSEDPPPSSSTDDAFRFEKQGELGFCRDSVLIKQVDIELARTDAERAQGLMNRPWMEETHAMIFFMDREERQSFWMRNTIIPLDIIFVNSDLRIVSIAEDTQPMSDRAIPSRGPALYVVEVIAGFTQKYGLQAGDEIRFEIMDS